MLRSYRDRNPITVKLPPNKKVKIEIIAVTHGGKRFDIACVNASNFLSMCI